MRRRRKRSDSKRKILKGFESRDRIHIFGQKSGSVICTDPDLDPDPDSDPSSTSKKSKKNLDFYYLYLDFLSLKNDLNVPTFKKYRR
jgi:hypothetical protein